MQTVAERRFLDNRYLLNNKQPKFKKKFPKEKQNSSLYKIKTKITS